MEDSDRSSEVARWLLPVFLFAILGGVLIFAKDQVDQRLLRAGGEWSIDYGTLPSWFPRQFQGELSSLRSVPARVSLESVRWRDEIRREVEKNPWIARVDQIHRVSTGVGFDGQFLRPAVGVHCDKGWLLVDGAGYVIDFQEGDFLDESWQIPEFIPEQGALERLQPGQSLSGPEFPELLSLLAVLWQERVFDRVPGFIHELAVSRDEGGQRVWSLHTRMGIPLEWGRAPAAAAPQVYSLETKLHCLRSVIENRERIRGDVGVRRISLCSGPAPVVKD